MTGRTSLIASLTAALIVGAGMFFVGALSLRSEVVSRDAVETVGVSETETTEAVGGITESPKVSGVERSARVYLTCDPDVAEVVTETEVVTEIEIVTEVVTEIETEVEIVPETEIVLEASAQRVAEGFDPAHDAVLREVCASSGVPYEIALALIWHESRYVEDAVNPDSGCYGYCQLNPDFFPAGLSPEDNIRRGIGWLGELIAQRGDVASALTVYAHGEDNGSRTFAGEIFEIVGGWQ